MKKKGITLVELMISLGIMTVIFSVIFTTYLTTQKLWRGGFTQVVFQSRGRIALMRMSENIRSSTSAAILNNGDRIRFTTDPNHTPATSSDDITGEYYVSGTEIFYDPDITVSGDEAVLLRSAYKESMVPFFQASGDMVVVTFRLYNADSVYGVNWSDMTTSVKMRNS